MRDYGEPGGFGQPGLDDENWEWQQEEPWLDEPSCFEPVLEEQSLVCVRCGEDFWLGVEDQERYLSQGMDLPNLCPQCRAADRVAKNGSKSCRRGGGQTD